MRVRRTRRSPVVDDGWTSEVSSGFALVGFLLVVFAMLTLLAMGPLSRFDTYFNLAPPPRGWLPVLHVVDRVGQRAVVVPILAVVTYRVCRRTNSLRPALVAAGGVFVLNLVVLILKVGLGRDSPQSADPSFFTGGMAYPSGHSSNVVLVYGLMSYLLLHYTDPGRRTRIFLWALVPVVSLAMVVTSLTLNWHWFSDLIAGLVIGGAVLQLTAAVDRAAPDTELALSRQGVRDALRLVRLGRSRGRAGPA